MPETRTKLRTRLRKEAESATVAELGTGNAVAIHKEIDALAKNKIEMLEDIERLIKISAGIVQLYLIGARNFLSSPRADVNPSHQLKAMTLCKQGTDQAIAIARAAIEFREAYGKPQAAPTPVKAEGPSFEDDPPAAAA